MSEKSSRVHDKCLGAATKTRQKQSHTQKWWRSLWIRGYLRFTFLFDSLCLLTSAAARHICLRMEKKNHFFHRGHTLHRAKLHGVLLVFSCFVMCAVDTDSIRQWMARAHSTSFRMMQRDAEQWAEIKGLELCVSVENNRRRNFRHSHTFRFFMVKRNRYINSINWMKYVCIRVCVRERESERKGEKRLKQVRYA